MRIQEAKKEIMQGSLTVRIDYSDGNITYVGYAVPGSSEDEAKWQIRKFEYDASGNLIAVKFANGTIGFDKIWNNRTSYDYS